MVLPKLIRSARHAATGIVLLNSFVGLDQATALPPNFHYSGYLAKPTEQHRPFPTELQEWLAENSGKGIIYVTFGSMVDLSQQFIECIYEGLKRTGMAVLWSLRKGNIPEANPRMYIRPWLPQADLLALPSVKAVITHCGWNGVLDCIEAEKPMLMVPEFNDQPSNCERLLQLGTGVRLYKKTATLFLWKSLQIKEVRFTPDHLARSLAEVIGNPSYLSAVKRLKKLSKQSLGVQGSCDLIERVMEDGYEHLQDRDSIRIQSSSGLPGLLLLILIALFVGNALLGYVLATQ